MRVLRSVCVRVLILVGVCVCVGVASASAQSHVLERQGNHFTVDGVPRFLTFISYFDALDVSDGNLEADFAYLRSKGIDGIRIFPNWWTINPNTWAQDTVIDPNGNIREGPYANMVYVLDRANAWGLLVDISFSAENVADCPSDDCDANNPGYASLTMDEFEHGIVEITSRLNNANYRHVLFDLQNESNTQGPLWAVLSDGDVARLRNSVKGVDGSRLVTASIDQTWSADDARNRADATGQDLVAYHEERNANWWTVSGFVAQALRASGKPAYLQEPVPFPDVTTDPETWLRAAEEAKKGGAAIWCFHTRAGHYMNGTRIENNLDPVEKNVLDNLSWRLAGENWGI